MAILIRVLMLVACGPLLVPPGFCVCKAAVTSCTPSHRESVGEQATPVEPPHSTARCSHRHDTPNAASDFTPPGVPTPPAPAPHDDEDHAPGCPAATASVERLQWVEPTADTAPVAVQVAFIGVFLVPAACCPPDRHVLNWPSSPPLYLTHCSLVI